MADNEIVYEVKANTKDVDSALKNIDKKANEVGGDGGGIGSISKSFASIGTAAAAAGAAIATYLVGQGLSASISAAMEADDNISRLNNALENVGRLSQASSQDLQNFASQMQDTTKFSDDAVMSMLSLATAFTKTNDQSKQLVQTAINMSAQFGISAETLTRQLGGALNGTVGGLAKLVPELRNFTEEQLKAGKANEYLAQRFKGAGEAAGNTFSGSLSKVKNAFGDVLEQFGFFFTRSDALRKAFLFISDAVKAFVGRLTSFREESGDVFKPILTGIGFFAQGVITVVGPIIEFIINIIQDAIQSVARLSAAFVEFFSGNFSGAAALVKDQIKDQMNFDDIFDMSGTQSAQNFVNGFISTIQNSSGIIQENLPEEMRGGVVVAPDKVAETLESLDLVTFAYVNFFDKVTKKMEDFKTNSDKLKEGLKKGLFQTMVNGVSSAMNAVGQALVNGGNAFEAFGKALLSMFGQMAMQLGMFYFLLGLATVYNDPPRGAGMIAGGLALMVFGGVLQALAGGGGGGASAGAGGGGGGAATGTSGTVGDTTVAQNQQEERQRETNIEVVVQGNVIGDKREFGLMVADSINEAFGNDGLIIARGAIS